MKVYLGWDDREQEAYRVAEQSLQRHSGITATPLKAERLADVGLLRRPTDTRGKIYDLPSNAYCSTQFAISRFMVPMLAHNGSALFADCDVVFLADVNELTYIADPSFAVMVVKHNQAGGGLKMDGQAQLSYGRKNWSSVCLWNVDHPANKRLSVQDVNERPGRDLHQFYWLADSEIGELPPEWNWLVNVQPKPQTPKIAHFTEGGPWLPNWTPAEHDDIWTSEEAKCRQ